MTDANSDFIVILIYSGIIASEALLPINNVLRTFTANAMEGVLVHQDNKLDHGSVMVLFFPCKRHISGWVVCYSGASLNFGN